MSVLLPSPVSQTLVSTGTGASLLARSSDFSGCVPVLRGDGALQVNQSSVLPPVDGQQRAGVMAHSDE